MYDPSPIREVLRSLSPSVAHRANETPNLDEFYSPPHHSAAIDPRRTLVVGGRGVGKSYWASVLYDKAARQAASRAYPHLNLDHLDVWLGFHEGASGSNSVAPSALALRGALSTASDSASIWRSVILKAVSPENGPTTLKERVEWIECNPEEYEDALLEADKRFRAEGKIALVVFDALDVLATDWETIRTLTQGLARTALELAGLQSIRIKIFMRRDQYADMSRRAVADFSKLKTAAVSLDWEWVDLYGVLFSRLWRNQSSLLEFLKILKDANISGTATDDMPEALKIDSGLQEKCFSLIAGEFMGASKKRGLTYSWLPKHLADAQGETTLRSFLIALKEAAERADGKVITAINANGINEGVKKASETKLEELQEDNPWIKDALDALSGLTVPCDEKDFLEAWKIDETVDKIKKRRDASRPTAPLQLDLMEASGAVEEGLLKALEDLAVIERRSENKINVPDIFRTAARMKRKGGISLKKRGRS